MNTKVSRTNSETYKFKELVKRCSKGDRRAQEHLFKLFYGYAMGVALRYSDGKESASEIVNDSFLKVFQNIEKHRKDCEFKAWLGRIVVNTSLDHYRRNKKHEGQLPMGSVEIEPVDNSLLDSVNAEEIISWLHQLPSTYRLIFNLYEIEGYSHKEIAARIGIPEGTCRSGLTRAKKMLRSLILENKCHERV